MSLTKSAVDILGVKLLDEKNVSGPITPTGMTKGPHGEIIINPSMSSPRTTKTGVLIDPGIPVNRADQQPQQQQEAPPAKKSRKRKTEAAPVKREPMKATVIVNGMRIPTQYVDIRRGTGVLVLWTNELSFVPEQAMKGQDGNITGKFEIEGYAGTWANLGQSFVDRDGTKAILVWPMS